MLMQETIQKLQKCYPQAERNNFEQSKSGQVIAESMAAMGHTMETVASKCLCKKQSRSFRSAIPQAERNNFEQSKYGPVITESYKKYNGNSRLRMLVQERICKLQKCYPQAERNNFEQSKKVHVITEAMAAMENAMELLPSESLITQKHPF